MTPELLARAKFTRRERWKSFFRKSEFQVFAERCRVARAHAEVEKTRLPELINQYKQYSTWVEADGKQIKVIVLEHEFTGGKWVARRTKKSYNTNTEKWDDAGDFHISIVEAKIDSINEEVKRVQEIAERLEIESYIDVLEHYQAKCLALALQPPPVSSESIAKLIVSDELQRVLQATPDLEHTDETELTSKEPEEEMTSVEQVTLTMLMGKTPKRIIFNHLYEVHAMGRSQASQTYKRALKHAKIVNPDFKEVEE